MKTSIVLLSLIVISCHNHCDVVRKVKEQEMKGVIVRKYVESFNHGAPHLDISSSKKEEYDNLYLVHELGGIWDFIEVGDSVIKEKGDFTIKIVKSNKTEFRKLDYGCSE